MFHKTIRRGAAAVLLALLPACATDPVTGRWYFDPYQVSEEEEIGMGNLYAPDVTQSSDGEYPDPELREHLQRAIDRLGLAGHRPRLRYRLCVLNTSEPNAFALPGGRIFVTRGLLARMDSENEFACALGHEIGHVVHRHSVKQMGHEFVAGIVLGGLSLAAGDSGAGEAVGVAGGIAGGLVLLRYSRDQEREADERGVEYAFKTGYDPRGFRRVFAQFKEIRAGAGGGEGPLDAWLSSHPLDDERIANVQAKIAREFPGLAGEAPAADLLVTTPEYARLVARVREAQKVYDDYDKAAQAALEAIQEGDEEALRATLPAFEDGGKRLPDHALFPNAAGSIHYYLGEPDRAIPLLERARKLDPDLFEPHYWLGRIAYEQGRPHSAWPEIERAAELFPSHPAPHLFRGYILEEKGQKEEAIEAYAKVLELAPEKSEEYPKARERLGRLDPERLAEIEE